jgi:hypothetical protein
MSFFAWRFPLPRRELNIALALSCLLHLGLLFPLHWAGVWQPPAPLPPPLRLDAALVRPLPAPVTPVAPLSLPVVPAPVDPVLPHAALPPVETLPVETSSAPEADAQPPEGAASGLSPEPEIQEDFSSSEGDIDFFPPRGEVRYIVYRGTQGFEVGRAELRWEVAEGRYRLASLLRTTGLAALFYPVHIASESTGSIGARGLMPERYQQTRNQDAPEEVTFDHATQQIRINQGQPVTMNANSHDFLSLQCQFAYNVLPASVAVGVRGALDFWLATHKKYEHVQFVIIGEETLDLPAGRFDTLHVQAVDSSSVDLWLAQDYLMLPVRLHFTDKNGDHYEQAASEILIEPMPEEDMPEEGEEEKGGE